VIGCHRPSRSKGYCSAHYQKLRLLVKTGRRPASWVDDAAPRSVPEIVLPRGRAAHRREEEQLELQPPAEPAEPPKPKVWVRKKGASEKVSLV
jgi:histone H1/5